MGDAAMPRHDRQIVVRYRPGKDVDIREDCADHTGKNGDSAYRAGRLLPGKRRPRRLTGEKGFAEQRANDAMSDGIHSEGRIRHELRDAELFDLHEWRALFENPADTAPGYFVRGESLHGLIGTLGIQGHKEPARGLRIGEQQPPGRLEMRRIGR